MRGRDERFVDADVRRWRATDDDGAEHVYVDAADTARTLVHIDRPDSRVATLPAHKSHAGLHDGEQEDIEQGDQDDAACKKDDIDVHKRLSPKFKGAQAKRQQIAVAQRAARNAAVVDERAVGGIEVLDRPIRARKGELGVAARHVGVAQGNIGN